MEVQDKRKLLEAIDKLVKRPGDVTDQDFIDATKGFKALIESSTGGMLEVNYSVKEV